MGIGGGGLEGLTSQSGGGGGGSAVTGIGIWRYRTETSAPPNSGQLRFNNSDIESANVMFLHETNADGTDMANFLEQLGVGAFLYIQDRSDASNFIVVQIASNVDSGSYRTFGIAQVELQGVTPSNNTQVAIVATGDPSPAVAFPEFQFAPLTLEIPNNSDWAVNALAPAAADSINAGLTVRLFDDTIEEGVGFQMAIPSAATNLIIGFRSRASIAPAGSRTVGLNLYQRGVPDNSGVDAWSAGTQLTDIDIPNSNLFQVDSQTITLASLGITAGELTQFELTRIAPSGGVNLVGDWALVQVTIGFS